MRNLVVLVMSVVMTGLCSRSHWSAVSAARGDLAPSTHHTFLPLIPNEGCKGHTASMTLSSTATSLQIGEAVTLTVTLLNEGCVGLGLPQYRMYVHSAGTDPVLEPSSPEPVVHYYGIAPGQSDSEEFQLRAVGLGEATLSASASFEVHLGYPGPAYWGSSSSEPLTINVMPGITASPTPTSTPAGATPTPTPTSALPTPTATPTETGASLLVQKIAEPETVGPGGVITYTIVIMNDMLGETDPGTFVILADAVPTHTMYLSGTVSVAQYDADTDRITWTGSVLPGGSVAVSFQVRVDAAPLEITSIRNVARVEDALGRTYEAWATVPVCMAAETPVPVVARARPQRQSIGVHSPHPSSD